MLPDTPERAQQEPDFQLALGPVSPCGQGAGAPEVEQTYARARELCGQGETPQRFQVLWGLWYFSTWPGRSTAQWASWVSSS